MPDNPGLTGRATPSQRTRRNTRLPRNVAPLILPAPTNVARHALHAAVRETRADEQPELDAATDKLVAADC